MNRDGVEARRVAFLILSDITDSAVIKPECFAAVRQGELNGFNAGRLERCDEDRLVIST